MHLSVAIQASVGKQKLGPWVFGRPACQCRQAAMPHRGVASLTELRCPAHQQRRLVGAVRQVANAAILAGGRVFPKKGALLFRVASETGLVGRLLAQQAVAAMGVVAIPADQLMFAQRMGGQFEQVGAHFPVTVEAAASLPGLGAYRINAIVNAVAIGARDITLLVGAAGPTGAPIVFVTSEAEVVLQVSRGVGLAPEIENGLPFRAFAQHALAVLADGPVASFALQACWMQDGRTGFKRRARNARMAVDVVENRGGGERLAIVMAAQAGVRATAGVVPRRQSCGQRSIGIA